MATDKKRWNMSDGLGSQSDCMGKNEGVYVILHYPIFSNSNKIDVLYVGRSMNLAERWKSHNIYKRAINDGYFPAVKWKLCNNSAELEKKLINRLSPPYNKQFNHG